MNTRQKTVGEEMAKFLVFFLIIIIGAAVMAWILGPFSPFTGLFWSWIKTALLFAIFVGLAEALLWLYMEIRDHRL